MTLQEILESVKSGSVSVEEAERILKKESYEEMGYAKLDTSRKARTGFAEVIYCSNKADEHLLNIFERLYREDGGVFGTRASQHQYELVKEKFPEVEYDKVDKVRGMDIIFVTTAKTDEEARELLTLFNMPFAK